VVLAIAAMGGLLIDDIAEAAPSVSGAATVSAALDDSSTSTTLIVAPNSLPQGLPLTLIAIGKPRAAVGAVQFKDGDSNIGDPVAVIPETSRPVIRFMPTPVARSSICP
jgi:hypothetical protein